LKATELIKELIQLIEQYSKNIDVQTFTGELGIYDDWDEIKRINIEK